ncbi:hypothetical protein SK3146_00056 [Paenibacillus konkukensis]|uniref:ABC transporter substrate-binding protein n=1 Tax=Paenibacillus konkukensis TaxID=2020716 RepID=A0ABY4RFL8_9BACL|nr:hypothetical protein [Paenibacillus konkukensis]UQZ80900.1 hypothetical protein SK3146_00056 [Paenibacillus konkukensis]
MRKYWLSSLGLCLLAGSMTSACSQQDGESSAVAKTEADQPVELFFYSGGGDTMEAFDARFGDAIRRKFPGYDIKYIPVDPNNRIQQLVTAGQRIDLYYGSIGVFNESITAGLQLDLTDLLKKHNVDLNALEPTLLEAAKTVSDGKLYGLPVFNNMMVTLNFESTIV